VVWSWFCRTTAARLTDDAMTLVGRRHGGRPRRMSRLSDAHSRRGSTVSGVVTEVDGELWEPVPSAAVTAEEFMTARSLIQEIHRSLWWNPWWMTERRAEYDAAWEACGQWTHADPDPGPPGKSVEEYEAEGPQAYIRDRCTSPLPFGRQGDRADLYSACPDMSELMRGCR
jgi:hypothetical protein